MQDTTANSLLSFRLIGGQIAHSVSAGDASGRITRLTRGLAKGDEAAFREFHQQYFDRLYQFLLVVARGREDEAREALQQTVLRVLRYARQFDSEEAFWCWLKALARSVARDAGRKQQRYLALLNRFALRRSDQSSSQTSDELELLFVALDECLAKLDPADRLLLEAKYVEGATARELSNHSGVSEKALESRLLRLRRELRQRVLNYIRRT